MLPFSIAAAQWGIGLAAIGWISLMFSERKLALSLGSLTIPTACYIAICLITSACSERSGHSLASVWDNEWLLFSAIFIIALKPKPHELKTIILFLLIAGIASAVFGIIQHFTGIMRHSDPNDFWAYKIHGLQTYRTEGFFSHPLSYSSVIAMIFLLAAGILIAGYRGHNRMLIAACLLTAAAVFTSYSRGDLDFDCVGGNCAGCDCCK